MPRLPDGVRRAFRLATGRPRVERDVDAEVAFHLQMRTEELIAGGMPAAAARAEALRRFGDVQRWSEAMSETDRGRVERERRAEWWDAAWQDLRVTLRALGRQPGFTAGVVLTLALGIGANATMFGIVDRLMLRPPPHVADADRVRRPYMLFATEASPDDVRRSLSYAEFALLRDSVRTLSGLAAWTTEEAPVGTGDEARLVEVAAVSASFFPVLGVRPHLGRFFAPEEDRLPAGTPVAVLGYDLWRTAFGADPRVLGRSLRVRTRDFQIVGVAPPGFGGVDLARVDLWTPLTFRGAEVVGSIISDGPWHESRDVRWLEMVGRLAPGVDERQATAELTLHYRRALAGGSRPLSPAELDRQNPRMVAGPVLAERGPDRSAGARVTTWLAGVSLTVLLIAAANVANLLLARALRRRREIAVRTALGVGRARLVRFVMLEGVVLAALGGAAGLLVAQWVGSAARTLLFPGVAWDGPVADGRVLAFTAAVALLTGVLAGLPPALQAGRSDLVGWLKSGPREGGGQGARLRSLLFVTQGALSVVLLVGAGLFVRSLRNVTAVGFGYDADRLLVVEAGLRSAGYTEDEVVAIYDRVHERARATPGVASAGLAVTYPFRGRINVPLSVPGRDSIPTLPTGVPLLNAVSADYFPTVGTRIVRGRAFGPEDRDGAPGVVVVNETMARMLWPGQSALGKCVRIGPADTVPCAEVVGVAEEVRWSGTRPEPTMQYYVPLAQYGDDYKMRALYLRPAPGQQPGAIAAAVRREMLAAAPRLAFARVRPLADYAAPTLRPWRLGAGVFSAFGVLALLIAAVGLYSVLAYTVAQRTHEIGVRIALGARLAHVLRLVVGEGLRVTALGVLIGLGVALAAGRRLAELLYEVSPTDPLVLGVVAGTLLLVAAVASLLPAWRAARVNPNVALRVE